MDKAVNVHYEPLLDIIGNNKYYLFPLKDIEIWEFHKRVERTLWTADEISLSKDIDYWIKLTDSERFILKEILGFFAAADGIVNDNLSINFAVEVSLPEARAFYTLQQYFETVHQEMYFRILNMYVKDEKERERLFRSIETNTYIKKKADWAIRFIGLESDVTKKPFSIRLFAFACVEGVHFASSFATIAWFKKRNMLPGLSLANEYISRDETTHWQFAALLFSRLVNKPTESKIHEIMSEAVNLEAEFVDNLFSDNPLVGLNSTMMIQYVKSIANLILSTFGYSNLYPGVVNPFNFMQLIEVPSYSNFFEKESTEYQRSSIRSVNLMEEIDKIDF